VVSTGDGTVTLDWNDETGNFGHYQVYRNDRLISDGPSVSSYTDTGLTNGTTYTYRVSAGANPIYSAWTSPVSATPAGPTPTPTPTPVPGSADLWHPNLLSTALGFVPLLGSPIPGFQYTPWEVTGGGAVSVQSFLSLLTPAYRSYLASGATSTERAEQVPTYDPGGQGTTFWLGFDFAVPTWSTPTSWGPLIMQLKRDGLGNGPVAMNLHNGRMVVEGASGTTLGSSIDLGPIPAPGSKTRIVLGFYLDPTNGWVEAWRDGSQIARVAPWVSKDTSTDGPGNWGSTLTGGVGVYLKLGGYRGGSGGAIDLRYSDLRAATTRAGAM
jgi:hypothetical protein